MSQCLIRDEALHLRTIHSWMTTARIEQAIRPVRFVTEQEKAFRIAVQPADGIHMGWKPEVRESPVLRQLTGELGEHVEGFVKCDEHRGMIARRLRSCQQRNRADK